MKKPLLLSLLAVALASGCAEDFDPYEDVQTPRLLAVAAEAPFVVPGSSATLSALVTDTTSSRSWSWCPIPGPSAQGYPCLITEEQLVQAVVAAGGSAADVPSFDLGSEPTASLAHSIDPAIWIGLCDALQNGDVASPVAFPRCTEYLDVTVRLTVELGGRRIDSIRDIRLLYAADAPGNSNPVLGEITAIDPQSGDEFVLDDAAPALRREVEYGLRVDLSADQAESYQRVPVEGGPAETVLENLRISWFHEGGEIDRSATGTNETTPLEAARTNDWLTPSTAERAAGSARLFLVVRDNRGGTSWIERTVRLGR